MNARIANSLCLAIVLGGCAQVGDLYIQDSAAVGLAPLVKGAVEFKRTNAPQGEWEIVLNDFEVDPYPGINAYATFRGNFVACAARNLAKDLRHRFVFMVEEKNGRVTVKPPSRDKIGFITFYASPPAQTPPFGNSRVVPIYGEGADKGMTRFCDEMPAGIAKSGGLAPQRPSTK